MTPRLIGFIPTATRDYQEKGVVPRRKGGRTPQANF